MICPNCGTENDVGRKFCIECATPLAAGCPNCGTQNPPNAKFCGECARPLTPGAIARSPGPADPTTPAGPTAAESQPPTAVAERRLVSILFADLVGFTPFSEGRDAEEVRDTLSRYFELASDVIGRYGGVVEKFIGDAVMAVWGAPTTHEDDAERAVRAGLELVELVRTLGGGIDARAGVLTGEAAVTLGATNQGMVAGDIVNTAARLQSVAPPGAVLVGEATHRSASSAIAFEPAGEQALKGKTAPVPAWRALRVVAQVGGRNRSETLEAPFVGRDEDLRLLKDLFHATTREGRARLVSVIGPAGIGKTRLAWEFLKYLDGLVETVWFHEGRSPAYGEGIAFWALGEMVRRRAGLLETDDEAATRERIGAMLAEHVPDPDERRWIEPAMLELLGLGGTSGSERAKGASGSGSTQLFAAWRTFFERLAATAPVVLVFEDFHFADRGLIDFVDHVMEWSRHVPLYLVTLSRPELLDKRPDWSTGKRAFTSLYLEPLSQPAMRELLVGLVPGLPERAVRAIVARADGIPLYAVETVRMLLADGKLEQVGESYRPVGDLGDLAVPETLTALIASRLDALDPADRALLQDAAVVGQSFTPASLSAVTSVADDALIPRLNGLVRREFLAVEADDRSPERGQYVFVQALIREVAYGMLARPERKARHLAAARYFEALGSDELAGALAGHYLAAHTNAADGPEREALAGQARIALRAAAERAATLGAHGQALVLFEQALEVASDPMDVAVLHERAGDSASLLQEADPAVAHYEAANERFAALGDRSAEARVATSHGRAQLTSYSFGLGLAYLTAAVERLADLGDDPAYLRLQGQYARALWFNDHDRDAIAATDRVLEAAEPADLVDIIADTLITRGSAFQELGRAHEGQGLIEAGYRLGVAHSLYMVQSRALINMASFFLDSDPRKSLAAGQEGLALQRRYGVRSFQMMDNTFTAAMRVGDWDFAAEVLEPMLGDEVDPVIRSAALGDATILAAARGEPTDELVARLDAIPDRDDDTVKATTSSWARALVAYARGDYELARKEISRAGDLYSQAEADAYLVAARSALHAGDAAGAAADLARVDRLPRRGRAIDNDRLIIRAGIAALEGRPAEALAGYRDALETWRDLGLAWDEAQLAFDMASFLDPAEPEVRAAAESGRAQMERLGAGRYLELLDAAIDRPRDPRKSPPPVAAEEHRRATARE